MSQQVIILYTILLILVATTAAVHGNPGSCDQTPEGATVLTPSENKNLPYTLAFKTSRDADVGKFQPHQTYVLILKTSDSTRPFKEFMITAEDTKFDEGSYLHSRTDVGSLKILEDDHQSRYSARCPNSIENTDSSDKTRVEIHWVSPKYSVGDQKIRFRAMIAENKATWYTGEELTAVLGKETIQAMDSPPLPPQTTCDLYEARYEVIFKGKWSSGTHSYRFPKRPDQTRYSKMVGASHDYNYTLWELNRDATLGLKLVAENADISEIEKEIVANMALESGTRTLIRGKEHRHPHMSEPSRALFRVDKVHHLFSVVIGMRPSPDWFLGTTKFELCTPKGWLKQHEIPLYPFDAGTKDGISYDDITEQSVTNPPGKIERVAMGSFDKKSPFYQMNLDDLKPFAMLEVRMLDIYPPVNCDDGNQGVEIRSEAEEEEENANDEPMTSEVRECPGEWGDWSPCVPDDGDCGPGTRTRFRYQTTGRQRKPSYRPDVQRLHVQPNSSCSKKPEAEYCFVNCF